MISTKDYINLIRPGIQRYVNNILNDIHNEKIIVEMIKEDRYNDLTKFIGEELIKKAKKDGE